MSWGDVVSAGELIIIARVTSVTLPQYVYPAGTATVINKYLDNRWRAKVAQTK